MSVSAKSIFVTIALLCGGVVALPSTVMGQFRANSIPSMNSSLIHKSRIAAYTDSSLDMDNLPSPSRAAFWSSATTFVPIVAGVVILSLQKSEHIVGYDAQGVFRDYFKDPDRTVPVLMIASGIFLGPSTGYFYGRCADRGVKGILIRILTGTVTGAVAYALASSADSGDFGQDLARGFIVVTVGCIGAGIVIIDAVHDLAKVKSTVRKHNEKVLNITIGLSPKIFSDGNAPGLEFRAMF
jgi:hypothetical protein